ncbi:hypothetical protein [Shewanella atlantica]|uniref:Uncharacterized protein n=1 Tax=Shewanella atlantica TaxID=271099 RepID=A0A431VVZ3_9GAMM|nr:hypothetical protein [Shewanella atlantica]RTR27209.1 hypothetical protein EKG39_20685 [Shewanella atlantica]
MQYDKQKFKAMQLPNPMLLHWMINPAMAVNELLLGQRLPKVTLIDQDSDKPLVERQIVPCPHCNAMNDGMLWSKGNSFGHWFGYVCPECEGKIPCLWNFTSLLILAITSPIWYWFRSSAERKWLAKEYRRVTAMKSKAEFSGATTKPISYARMGLFFGFFMFLLTLVIQAVQAGLTVENTLKALAFNTLGGILFGVGMKLFLNQKNKRKL